MNLLSGRIIEHAPLFEFSDTVNVIFIVLGILFMAAGLWLERAA